jgi:hypothetical protein
MTLVPGSLVQTPYPWMPISIGVVKSETIWITGWALRWSTRRPEWPWNSMRKETAITPYRPNLMLLSVSGLRAD